MGKYALTESYQPFFEQVIADYGLQVLPIEIRHTAVLATLPLHHRDPFDRLLIAQAIAEELPLSATRFSLTLIRSLDCGETCCHD